VALDSSGPSEITGNSAIINYTSETLTTGYYMVLARGSAVPTADQIIDNSLYTSSTIIQNGSVTMPAGTETPFEITGLNPGSDYDVYFVTRNANGDTSSVAVTRFSTAPVAIISLTTIDSIDFPKNNRLPDVEEIDTVEYTATVSWTPADDHFKDDLAYVATITITPKEGYTLTGVAANAFTVSGASTTTNSVNSGVITATFPKVLFDQVIFHSNGGSSVDQIGVDVDALITKPSDPTRLGYDFLAWYQDNTTFENPWTFETEVMPLSDLDLYAKWALKNYTISYVLDGGTNFSDAESIYTIESSLFSLGIPTKAGYSFGGWYGNADLSSGGEITSIPSGSAGNISLYAKWNPLAVEVSSDPSLGVILEGAAEAIPFTPEELAQEVSVKLQMVMVESTNLNPEELTIMNDYVATHVDGDLKHFILFDFSLFKIVGDQETAITSTTSLIKITFLVPEEYRGQELHIIRIHEGVAEMLDVSYNPETYELTFYTDKFSTYGLAYGDPKMPYTGQSNTIEALIVLMSLLGLLLTHDRRMN